jgi:hypothetical protein
VTFRDEGLGLGGDTHKDLDHRDELFHGVGLGESSASVVECLLEE